MIFGNNKENSNSKLPLEPQEYVRVRSAPPQDSKEEGEIKQSFQLLNADGTPLIISADSFDSSDESVDENLALQLQRTLKEKADLLLSKDDKSATPSVNNDSQQHAKENKVPVRNNSPASINKATETAVDSKVHDRSSSFGSVNKTSEIVCDSKVPVRNNTSGSVNKATEAAHASQVSARNSSPGSMNRATESVLNNQASNRNDSFGSINKASETVFENKNKPEDSCKSNINSSKKVQIQYSSYDCSSSEEEEFLDPFDRFIQLIGLELCFPGIDNASIKNKITDFLASKERTPVDCKFIISRKESPSSIQDKLKVLKEKEDSCLEKVRHEFNRVTFSNVKEVIDSLLSINVQTVDEMKEIAAFVFEKTINEPLFIDEYVKIIGDLKKSWRCEEEKTMKDKTQTCFFGSIIKWLVHKIRGKHSWNSSVDPSTFKTSNEKELEILIEESEAERIHRKKQSMGAIDLLINLYDKNVTGPVNIVTAISDLINQNTPESVEMLCYICKNITTKFIQNNKENSIFEIHKYLKKHIGLHGPRMDFLIENVLESSTLKKESGRTFSNLMEVSDTHEIPQKTEDDEVNDLVFKISKDLTEFGNEQEFNEIAEEARKGMDKFSKDKFIEAYFIEMISNHKVTDHMQNIFLTKLKEHVVSLINVLKSVKDQLNLLVLDFPLAGRRFAELLCFLRSDSSISADELEMLKPGEFLKKAASLLRRWKDTGDSRLLTVISSDDIEKI